MNNIKLYFTFTYLHLGDKFYTPQYVFDNNFAWMDIKYQYIVGNYHKDSRHLASVDYNWDLTELQLVELLWERLALYWFHQKTIDKALAYGQYISENTEFVL